MNHKGHKPYRLKVDSNPERVARVFRMLSEGKSKNQIAKALSVHKNTLYRSLRRLEAMQ